MKQKSNSLKLKPRIVISLPIPVLNYFKIRPLTPPVGGWLVTIVVHYTSSPKCLIFLYFKPSLRNANDNSGLNLLALWPTMSLVFIRKDCPICYSERFEALNRIRISNGNKTIVSSLIVWDNEDHLTYEQLSLSDATIHALEVKKGDTYFAQLISGFAETLTTVDPHLLRISSLSEIYTIPTKLIHAASHISKWISAHIEKPVLIGPDSGSEQWVSGVAKEANAPFTVLEKVRHGDRDVEVSILNVANYEDHNPAAKVINQLMQSLF